MGYVTWLTDSMKITPKGQQRPVQDKTYFIVMSEVQEKYSREPC